MGKDKALLPYPGAPGDLPTTFLERLIAVLDSCCVEVLIVAQDQEQATRYAHAGAQIMLDAIPGGGPLVGLYSGLQAVSTPHSIVVAVDMPFVTPVLLSALLSRYQHDSILVPLVNGQPQVTLAIYPRSILPVIEERIRQGRRDLRSLLDGAPVRYIDGEELRSVDPALRSFVGINTPEELEHYRSRHW